MWETDPGSEGGTLVIAHIDVPMAMDLTRQTFRREPEWLVGEGVGTTRGPLAMLELALRAAKAARALKGRKLAVLCYGDEGRDCRYSSELIRGLSARASRVLVLRPVVSVGRVVTGRRGFRTYRLSLEGESTRIGASSRNPGLVPGLFGHLSRLEGLSDRRARVAVVVTNLHLKAFPQRIPHEAAATVCMAYPTAQKADRVEQEMRKILGPSGNRWRLDVIADRPPMPERKDNVALAELAVRIADRWEIPLAAERSVLPSVAGLVPRSVPVLCGLGPVADEINTPQERISRISLMQRTLLLAQLLIVDSEGSGR
jgi:D-alanine-D-alanine ligase